MHRKCEEFRDVGLRTKNLLEFAWLHFPTYQTNFKNKSGVFIPPCPSLHPS